jgi:hypothetical protein
MKFLAFASALVSIAALLSAQAATDASHQVFQVPSGWERSDISGGTLLNPTASKNSVAIFLSGRPLPGTFREAFDSDIQAFSSGKRVVDGGQAQNRRSQNGVDLLFTTLTLKPSSGPTSYNYYLAANPQGRIEILLYSATSLDAFKRYLPEVQQFITTWTFAAPSDAPYSPLSVPPPGLPAGDQPNPNTPPGGPPNLNPPSNQQPNLSPPAADNAGLSDRMEGVYLGYKYNFKTTLGVVQKAASLDYYTFYPDGFVYWGLSDRGMLGFDRNQICAKRPEACGTYQLNGEQITILVNRGTYRQSGVRTPDRIVLGDRPYILQGDPAKTPSHTLEGVWGRADARPGEDLARKLIRFTRDGKFMDQGLITTVAGNDMVNGNLRFERPGGSGTYQLSKYTLILRYTDGYLRSLPIIIPLADMDKPIPSQLLVNTYTLVMRGR